MKIKTKFKDLFLIKNKSYKDNRGSFREVIKEKSINKRFPLVLTSYSKYNVTRGLHLQTKNPQSKFVTVIKGRIFDVVVDLRKNLKLMVNAILVF
jgi:dTDP-4-dehydrorhamnose 3,5-epimerase and related enzymes